MPRRRPGTPAAARPAASEVDFREEVLRGAGSARSEQEAAAAAAAHLEQQAAAAPGTGAGHGHATGAPRCRLCNWPSDIDPAEPDPNDVVEFVRCVALGQTFARVVPLFGGAAEVRFRDLTTDEEEAVHRKILVEVAAGKHPTVFDVELRYVDFRLSLAVDRLLLGATAYEPAAIAKPLEADLDRRHDELRSACKSQTLYQALRNYYVRRFLPTLGAIQARAVEPSFYKATAPSGSSAGPRSAAG